MRANRTIQSVLACCSALAGAGCVDFDERFLQAYVGLVSAPELARRETGAAECQADVCDKDLWLHVDISQSGAVLPVAPWHTCLQTFDLDFASFDDNQVVAASINETQGLRLAISTKDGVLHLADFGSSVDTHSVNIGAMGLAWSNAGDRLGAVARGGTTGQDAILILDANLTVLQEVEVKLPDARALEADSRFFVSWSPRDDFLAVSTSDADSAFIMNLDGPSVEQHALDNVFFVASDRIVAKTAGCITDCVWEFAFDGQNVVPVAVIPAAKSVIASHPVTGVFVTREPSVPGFLEDNPLGLRTLELGPDIFGFNVSSDAEIIAIIPLDVGLPVLDATGFGPDDAPQPDETGGCPE